MIFCDGIRTCLCLPAGRRESLNIALINSPSRLIISKTEIATEYLAMTGGQIALHFAMTRGVAERLSSLARQRILVKFNKKIRLLALTQRKPAPTNAKYWRRIL